VPYYASQGSAWINIGLTPITENCYNCSRQKQIPIFQSGTAEVGAERKPHAWFTGFLARDDFPLAFVVVIEGGGAGSRAAASVAAKILPVAIGVN